MNMGSVIACLRNGVRVPSCFKHVHFEAAESYNGIERVPLDRSTCAVLNCPPIDVRGSIHSILLEDDCVHLFDAQREAWSLQAECFFDRSADILSELDNILDAHAAKDVTRTLWPLSSLPAHVQPCPLLVDAARSHTDLSSFMQPKICPAYAQPLHTWSHTMQAQHEANMPSLSLSHFDLPLFERTLRDISMHNDVANAHIGLDHFIVTTWFVDQIRMPVQRISRDVQLQRDPATWQETIVNAWIDHVDLTMPIHLHVVHPQPTHVGGFASLHVLAIQSPTPGLASVLVEVLVFDEGYQFEMLRADTLSRIANHEMLFQLAQLGHHCMNSIPEVLCTIKCGTHEYPLNRLIAVEDAITITIRVYNDLQVTSSPLLGLEYVEIEDSTFLQVQKEKSADKTLNAGSSSGHQCRVLEYEDEVAWEVEVNNPTGHIPGLPTIPLEDQAEWIQNLATAWKSLQETFPQQGFEPKVRSWYLNSWGHTRSEQWRPITFPTSTDYWWNTIQTVWFDRLDVNAAVEVYLVSPDPPRPLNEMAFPFDIIIAQRLLDDQRPALVVARLLSLTTRTYTAAELLPTTVSGWQLIYHMGMDRFCSGISWSHDFFRLCQVFRDMRRIGAQPTEIRRGDCLVIDIHPPQQIQPFAEDDDETWLMGRNPIFNRPQPDFDADDWQEPQRHAEIAHALQGRWYTVIVFALRSNPLIGRISSGDLAHFYSQIAQMLQIQPHELVDMYEIDVPPQDLAPSFDYIWAAHRLTDLQPGSRARLVLCDMEFCSNLPRLATEVVRQLKLIVSPTTRTTLLQVFRLQPYCRQAPCLVQLNGQLIHGTGPIDLKHGDYLHIILGPCSEQQCLTTRAVATACHHGIQLDSVTLQTEGNLESLHLEQVPNMDAEVDSLPPDVEASLSEFMQKDIIVQKTSLANAPHVCRNDGEQQEVLRQLRELRNQHTENPDVIIMEALEAERPIIRDLHGLWLANMMGPNNEQQELNAHVWYVSHTRWRICPTARTALLTRDFTLWYDRIIATWQDQIDHTEGVTMLLATPQPRDHMGRPMIHVILAQHDDVQDEGACLITLLDNGYNRGHPEHQALVMPLRITHETLLTVANRINFCMQHIGTVRCSSRFGLFELTHEPMRARPGHAFEVHIQRSSSDAPEWFQMDHRPLFKHCMLPYVNAREVTR